MAELTGAGVAAEGAFMGTGRITRTPDDLGSKPGSWKNGRKSSGRTAGRVSSGMIDGGGGGGLLARNGAVPPLSSEAGGWAGKITSGRSGAAAARHHAGEAAAALGADGAAPRGPGQDHRLVSVGTNLGLPRTDAELLNRLHVLWSVVSVSKGG